ncbi:hypothetical protein HK102_012686, partial [Quaeritorhiza haematococci]
MDVQTKFDSDPGLALESSQPPPLPSQGVLVAASTNSGPRPSLDRIRAAARAMIRKGAGVMG